MIKGYGTGGTGGLVEMFLGLIEVLLSAYGSEVRTLELFWVIVLGLGLRFAVSIFILTF